MNSENLLSILYSSLEISSNSYNEMGHLVLYETSKKPMTIESIAECIKVNKMGTTGDGEGFYFFSQKQISTKNNDFNI